MRIGLLTSWASHSAGGMFDAVHRLAHQLQADPEIDVSVFAMADRRQPSIETGWGRASLCILPTQGPRAWGYAPQLSVALKGARLDLLHVHGLWMFYSLAAHGWANATRRPYVVTPHGMLDAWALRNSRFKKLIALWAYERQHLTDAACLHALCAEEARAIRQLGLRNRVCIVPNGLDAPAPADGGLPAWRSGLPANARILLYLGRLHPKKGLTNLLHAWRHFRRRADESGGDWHLAIAGWDQAGHEGELRRIVTASGMTRSVHFLGPMFGAEKERTFAAATGFVLPSVSEGLPIVVLEAWSHKLPVLMTRHCNLPEGFVSGGALEIPTDSDGIRFGLDRLAAMSDEQRQQMGESGRRLSRERFSQSASGDAIRSVYRWLLGCGARPDCVLDDLAPAAGDLAGRAQPVRDLLGRVAD
jgi:glycosyltransferase involved in cell wall biosynthesis